MTKTFFVSRDCKVMEISDIPGIIAGALEPYSKLDFSETRQAAIKMEHQDKIKKAILRGELVGRNPLTRKKEPFAIADRLKKLVLSIEEVNQYAKQFGVELKYKPLPEESGRYTLEEAARKISSETGERETDILDMLIDAVQQNKLPVYRPGSDVSYKPTTVSPFSNEVFGDDLNILMNEIFPRINWRFPDIEANDFNNNLAAACRGDPFSHPPKRKDEWFFAIEEMMFTYRKEFSEYPNQTQAWAYIWEHGVRGYEISTGKDSGREDALLMGGNSLSKKAFQKRFNRWSNGK